MFELTSQPPWDPGSPEHAEEELKAQMKRDFTAKDRMFVAEPKREKARPVA